MPIICDNYYYYVNRTRDTVVNNLTHTKKIKNKIKSKKIQSNRK